jgi:hypothetical protein
MKSRCPDALPFHGSLPTASSCSRTSLTALSSSAVKGASTKTASSAGWQAYARVLMDGFDNKYLLIGFDSMGNIIEII